MQFLIYMCTELATANSSLKVVTKVQFHHNSYYKEYIIREGECRTVLFTVKNETVKSYGIVQTTW